MLSEASREITFAYLSVSSYIRVTPFKWDKSSLKLSAKRSKTLGIFHFFFAIIFLLMNIHYIYKLKNIKRTTAGSDVVCGFKQAELRCVKVYANVGWLVIYLNNGLWLIGILVKNLVNKTEIVSYLNELPRIQAKIRARSGK